MRASTRAHTGICVCHTSMVTTPKANMVTKRMIYQYSGTEINNHQYTRRYNSKRRRTIKDKGERGVMEDKK